MICQSNVPGPALGITDRMEARPQPPLYPAGTDPG